MHSGFGFQIHQQVLPYGRRSTAFIVPSRQCGNPNFR